MVCTDLPAVDLDASETGCCPRFDPAPWDQQEFVFDRRPFVRATTVNFLHVPLNLHTVYQRVWAQVKAADAAPRGTFLVLSTDPSPWRGEHYFAVAHAVPAAENVTLSGTFLTKVFEGPFRDARRWCRDMQAYVSAQGRVIEKLYFFYTTCPKCARHYGQNYVVAFAEAGR